MPDETDIQRPYLLFLGDAHDDLAAKTAHGIADFSATTGWRGLAVTLPDFRLQPFSASSEPASSYSNESNRSLSVALGIVLPLRKATSRF